MKNLFNKKINNIKDNQIIHIFLSSDINYAPYVSTTMISILRNTKSFIHFHILYYQFKEETIEKLKSIKKQFKNFEIEFINMEKYKINKFPYTKRYSYCVFSRLFIPQILPEAEKVIYLDVDIIVIKDIKKLFDENIGDSIIAGVKEEHYSTAKLLKEDHPNFIQKFTYFNSGVLLLNNKKWQQTNYFEELCDFIRKNFNKLRLQDQDALNIVFEGKAKILSYNYNFNPYYYNKLIEIRPELKNVRKEAVILHYTATKPWEYKPIIFGREFWKIAKMSPFYDEINLQAKPKSKRKLLPLLFNMIR